MVEGPVSCDCRDPDTIVECDHHPTEPLWVVRCKTCGWQGRHESAKAAAIATWNAEHVEKAIREIERLRKENDELRAALENARRDIFSISPKAGSRSPLRKVAEAAALRIEGVLNNQQTTGT